MAQQFSQRVEGLLTPLPSPSLHTSEELTLANPFTPPPAMCPRPEAIANSCSPGNASLYPLTPSPHASEKLIPTTPLPSPPTAMCARPGASVNPPQPAKDNSYLAAKDISYSLAPSFDFVPRLVPNPATSVRGRVVIFNTLTNTFTLRALGSGMTLRSVILNSSRYRIHNMPIRAFENKVDLGEAGVRVGEGQVDGIIKELPRSVVVMRKFGWYQVLYVVRSVEEDFEKGKIKMDV